MPLSVVTMTKDSAGHLAWWLERVRRYADEVVVAVDRSSTDETYEIARTGADRVHVLELAGHSEPSKDWLLRQAGGDWVLMIDDDEALPHDADQLLPPMLADRRFTHYALPVRWVVRAPGEGLAWLRQHPWHGPRWVRLVRNVGGIARVLPLMHAMPEVAGEGRALPPDGAMALYHLDLLWRDRSAREAKVARYRAVAGSERPTGEEHYLYEDYASTLVHAPLPPGEDFPAAENLPVPEGLPAAGTGHPGRRAGVPEDVPVVSLAELDRHALDIGDEPPIWSVEWIGHDTPAQVLTNRGYAVRVRARNTSDATWRSPGTRRGRVVLSHRWESAEWGLEVPQGDVTLLERALAPGEAAELVAGLWTPPHPGRYTLVWDMLSEDVAWFSMRGAGALRIEVDVVDAGPRPAAPRFAGAVRSEPSDAAPTPPGRLVTLPPVRVLDTRDGTGVVEAPRGPVPADRGVVLRLAGVGGVPEEAVGVLTTVSVLDADYSGFVSAYPPDGTGPPAFPHVHFADDRRPVSATVVSPLGRGRGHGRLGFRLSGGPVGASAHLLVDVAGYLIPD